MSIKIKNEKAALGGEQLKLPKRRGKASLDARKARSGYVFVAPFIIGIILVYLPILLDSIWFSFYLIRPSGMESVGLSLYKSALDNSSFKQALLDSLAELVFQVPAILVFSLFIAVVLNQKMLGRAVFRAIFFVPVIIATGIMESINYDDSISENMGNVNDGSQIEDEGNGLVSITGLEDLFAMMKLGNQLVPYIMRLVTAIYDIVNYSGVQMLIFLAGLQSISPAIYEACTIDGATGWETFWKITFPMISPMILVNAIYTIIDAFTRSKSKMMIYLNGSSIDQHMRQAMSWIYFIVVIVILAVIAAVASSFIFYQRKD